MSARPGDLDELGWPGARRLTPSVVMLTGAERGKYPSGTSLLVSGDTATAVIDPSLAIATHGPPDVPVDHVVLSHVHEDHVAGLGMFPNAQVWVHPDDRIGLESLDGLLEMYGIDPGPTRDAWRRTVLDDFHYAPRPDANPLSPGVAVDLGGVVLRTVHLPGHTRGHCAVLVEDERHLGTPTDAPFDAAVVFVGDIDLSSFGPYYGDAWSDLDAFVDSLVRVRELRSPWYATFHHKGAVEGHDAFVTEVARFAAVIDDRDRRLLDFLDTPRTIDDVVTHGFIYRPGTQLSFASSVERRSMSMHLDRLARSGRVSIDASGRWRRAG